MSTVSPAPEGTRSVGLTDIGRVRGENQDAILADDELGLWLVADGMGGHAGGARASTIARDTIRQQVQSGAGLDDAVMAAHYAVRAEQRDQPDVGDMGTTIVAARELEGRDCEICWVGDSRAYSYSRTEHRLDMLTADHNVAGMLVASGALSPAEAACHPQRHVLTDCLGLAGDEEPRLGQLVRSWQSEELLILCSDGLSGELSDEEICQVLKDGVGLKDIAGSLLDRALAAGAHDNVSLVLVGPPKVSGGRKGRWLWPFRRGEGN
ncbi:serine/threonine-protein phosphatase [Wenzhouxiangella sp. AB-CW3]|uniref:PP2C family protein-serine/threonine phosphatase n=1 Tax=Wenzhouxiangella sp. AB-CW3 TaxID=2771012 RepID=UPI00168BCB2E|nr:protein phosphatase 2C domain-containing protein [Wenzhouxiangella sp. AB-CW3]QOC23117.1 serine/threonine-protein phosphatase [Wenzhouxiangella sp. AB-CW3]